MASFVVELDSNIKALSYLDNIRSKLSKIDLIMNPFDSKIVQIQDKGKVLFFLSIIPKFPDFWIIGLVLMIGAYYFTGFSLWLLPGFFLFAPIVLWSSYWYYFIFKLGLKKNNYMGDITVSMGEKFSRRLMEAWDNKK
jgi:hypothetical protein